MWVLEDRFAAGRPAWEHGGALFTDDVEPYELLKLRLLNGTHSLIAYLGALDGRATIPESIAQPFVADAARRVLHDDYLPTVTVPAGRRPRRLRGPALRRAGPTPRSGTAPSRSAPTARSSSASGCPNRHSCTCAAGRMPHHLALTVAAYLCCLAPPAGFDPGPHAAAMADPARARLAATRRRSRPSARVRRRPCSTTACSATRARRAHRDSPPASPSSST